MASKVRKKSEFSLHPSAPHDIVGDSVGGHTCRACGKRTGKTADRKVQFDFGSKWQQKLNTQLTLDPENKQ